MLEEHPHNGKRSENSPRDDITLTAFQRECLRAIAAMDGKTHGLGIKSELQERYGEQIFHGRLYPNLDQLVQAGFVEKGEIDKRTNSYELTGEGKTLLLDALAAFESDVGHLAEGE